MASPCDVLQILFGTNQRTNDLFRRLPTGPTTDANLEALEASADHDAANFAVSFAMPSAAINRTRRGIESRFAPSENSRLSIP